MKMVGINIFTLALFLLEIRYLNITIITSMENCDLKSTGFASKISVTF